MKQVLLLLLFVLTLHAELLLRSNFKSNLQGWRIPEYWNGELLHVDNMMHMKSTERGGKIFARSMNSCKQLNWAGQWLKVSLTASGNGELCVGIIKYYPDAENEQDKNQYEFSRTPFVLSETPQSFNYVFQLGKQMPVYITPILQLNGNGEAKLLSYHLETIAATGKKMENLNVHQMLCKNELIEKQKFRFSEANYPGMIFYNRQVYETKSDENGFLSIDNLTANHKGLGQVSAAADGAYAGNYIDVISKTEWGNFEKAASEIKLSQKIHCLFFGDSLADFDRGHNSIDKLCFWLEKSNPGFFSIKNVAVRGDYISRVEQRLKGEKVFMPGAYDNIFVEDYDLIVFWLGHNDTMTDRKSDFNKALVPPPEQEASFKRVIFHIREFSQAPILLIGPSPLNSKTLQERADKQAVDAKVILFGKTEHIKAYNQVLKKLAAELSLGYMNITEKFAEHADLPSLFKDDAVHLSEEGHRFVAWQILWAFKENPFLRKFCN